MSKGMLIFLAVLGGAMMLSNCGDKKAEAPKTQAQVEEEKRSLAPYTCERLGKQQLRDPDSWQKVSDSVHVTQPGNKYEYVATVHGRAKNGFGGYASATLVCSFNYNSDKVLVQVTK